jgi:CRP/FNR family transcriptional regulator
MDDILDIIRGIPLFSELNVQQIEQVRHIAENRHYQKGETIFSDGDPGDGFYVVARGKVKIYKVSFEGKEQILHIFGPGQPFGEVPVFTGKPFPASSLALENCQLLFFPRAAFASLLAEHPSLALSMLAVLSRRLRDFTVQIENLSLKEVPGRLASYLVYLMKEQKNDTLVRLSISKGQLASLLGTIPETLSRIFAKMSNQGLIAVEGKDIRILDREGLQAVAEQG